MKGVFYVTVLVIYDVDESLLVDTHTVDKTSVLASARAMSSGNKAYKLTCAITKLNEAFSHLRMGL